MAPLAGLDGPQLVVALLGAAAKQLYFDRRLEDWGMITDDDKRRFAEWLMGQAEGNHIAAEMAEHDARVLAPGRSIDERCDAARRVAELQRLSEAQFLVATDMLGAKSVRSKP